MMPRRAVEKSLTLLLVLLFSVPVSAKVIEQLIAVIDGEPYTLTSFASYAKSKMGRDFPTGELSQINEADREVLEQFITDKLLEAEVREAGIKVSDEDVTQYIDQIKTSKRLNDEELKTALANQGFTMEQYRAQVKYELEKGEILNRQVRQKVNITNDDVERYYKLNSKMYRTEERAHLLHILLRLPQNPTPQDVDAVIARAGELRERILGGEDFAKVAREFSQGAGQSDGGDIGWIKRGTLMNELEELAFSKLAVGQISDPLRTSLGVHIVKLEARDPGATVPLAKVSGKIKEELYARTLDEKFTKWVKSDLRRKHRIDVKLPGVVMKVEDSKDGTVDSLMAQSTRLNKKQDQSWWSFLNPFKQTGFDDEDPNSPMYGKNVVTVFGVPLGTTDAVGDAPDILANPPDKSAPSEPAKSGGFFSSVLDSLNPFGKR